MQPTEQRAGHRLRKFRLTIKAVFSLLFFILIYPACSSAENSDNPDALIAANLGRSELQINNCSQMYQLKSPRYKCGYLHAPENYSRTNSRLIKIPYLVIKPDGESFDKSLEPLLVTGGGGPGNAMLGSRQHTIAENEFWSYEQFSIADGRPLIVLENRGVGLSEPELDCHYSAELFTGQIWQKMQAMNNACGKSYIERGIDLSQYNVKTAALDIELFRHLYGQQQNNKLQQINLYGISYGTHIAMYYDQLFPYATRAMVLDSVSLTAADSTSELLTYAQRSFDLVFSQCRANARCNQQFGANLEKEFYDYLSRVANQSITIEVDWPDNHQAVSVPLSGPLIINVLHDALYSPLSIAGIPLTINHLMKADYRRLAAMLTNHAYTYSTRYGFSDTAFLTYLCFDQNYAPGNNSKLQKLKLYQYWEHDKGMRYMQRICSEYEIAADPTVQNDATSSSTPTLFLSGSLDPVTPPSGALEAAKNFRYHWNIVRDNVSHDVISHSSCARLLASWFVYHPQEDLALKESELCESTPYTIDFELR